MKNLYKNLKSCFVKSAFIRGTILGAAAVSFVSYAALTLTPFTSNTTISSSAMNGNLTAITNQFAKLDGTQVRLTTDYNHTCATSFPIFPTDFTTINFAVADSGASDFNLTTDEYTVPATGNYIIHFNVSNSTGSTYYEPKLVIDGISINTGSNTALSYVSRLTAGQVIKLMIGCDDKYGTNVILSAASAMLVIKPL